MPRRHHCVSLSIVVALLLVLPATGVWAQSFTEMVPMRDGVGLATDVYLPNGPGPWPVVLQRTPYGRAEFHDDALQYTVMGIATVNQDMRGRYDSEGLDMVFTTDGAGTLGDGVDTMAWIIGQAWCDGNIATAGESARGIVQYVQAAADPPGLVLVYPRVATPNLYQDVLFHDGVFRHGFVTEWLAAQGSMYFLSEIAAHPYEDGFWDPVQTGDQLADVHAAGFHEGGWFDLALQGTLDGFCGYMHQGGTGAEGQQKLVIGPWTHLGMFGTEQGELSFPANATAPPHANTWLVLLDHHLGLGLPGVVETPADIPAVQYYVMGDVDDPGASGNEWRTSTDWPPEAAPVRMHLQPGGVLAEDCPEVDGGVTEYGFDPAEPCPTVGGGNMYFSNGPRDQRDLEQRADVVVFETPALTNSMEITGRVRAHLFVDLDQPDADLMVRMSDVYPDGRSILFADGAARLAARGSTTGVAPLSPGEVVEAVVDLWSTSLILAPGHRLRISVTSSNHPRYAVNQHNGLDYPASVEGVGPPVTVRIHHSGALASYLEVPDPTRAPDDFVTCADPGPGDDDGGDDDGGDDDGGDDDGGGPASGDDDGGGGATGCGCHGAASESAASLPGALLVLACWLHRRSRFRQGHHGG